MTTPRTKRWGDVAFEELVAHSAFGPRFSGSAYADDGNIATLRTTDLDDDGRISYETMPLAELDEDRFGNHLLAAGDLVITRSGTCGIAAVFEGFSLPVLPGAFLIRFRMNERAEPRFYRYYFNAPAGRSNILSVARGAVQQNLNITNVETLRVPLPPISEQLRIVSILSAYDDLIENNRRRMALLEEAARQLYREWFVRLRFPGHEHTRITNGVPEAWERKTLEDLAGITMGQSPESRHYNTDGEGVPFHQGVTDFGDRFVTHRIYSTALNRLAGPGDILCSVRAPVGRLNVTLDKIVIGRGLAALRSKTGNQSLLLQQLRAHFFKEDLIGGGAIFASVTKKEFSAQELLEPPERLKRAVEEVTVPCDEQIRVLHLQNHQLRAARDLLLPRLMSGEIAA